MGPSPPFSAFLQRVMLHRLRKSCSPRDRVASLLWEKGPLHRQPEDHNFRSLIMLAVTAVAILLVNWVATP